MTSLNQDALNQLFLEARTYNSWSDQPVSEAQLKQIFDLLKMAPTAANCSPARFHFIKSDAAKARLKPCLADGNVEKTMAAPVCVIIAQDMEFYEYLPKLFPHTDARSWFAGNDDAITDTANRNALLQGAYLILAARAVGLDCGPMSGFDADAINAEFFADTPNIQANFICNLGYGTAEGLHERSPRFTFDDACAIL